MGVVVVAYVNPLAPFTDDEIIAEVERRRIGGYGLDHVIELGDDGYAVEHPFSCRVAHISLLDCPVWITLTSPYPLPGEDSKSDSYGSGEVADELVRRLGSGKYRLDGEGVSRLEEWAKGNVEVVVLERINVD